MRLKGFEGMACPIANVMEAIGDRWGLLVLRDLVLGLSRYEDIRKSTGATNATLSDRLRHLEKSGLVVREAYRTSPQRFEYLLTSKGRQLGLVMSAFAHVGEAWRNADSLEPSLLFVNSETGLQAKLAFVEQDTCKMLQPAEVSLSEGPGADEVMKWRLKEGEMRRRAR